MIYLSWSYAYLSIVILAICAVSVWAVRSKAAAKKTVAVWAAASILFSLFLAFDVGTRQESLQRSSFDAAPPIEQQKKTERSTLDRNAVQQTFEQAVKESK